MKKEKRLCGTKSCPEIAKAPNFTKRYVEGLSELAVTAPNRFHQSQRAKIIKQKKGKANAH